MVTAAAVCQHLRRILSTPNGPTITGTCVDCGNVRTYSSSLEGQIDKRQQTAWDSQTQSARRGARATRGRVNITLSQHKSEQETYVKPTTFVPTANQWPQMTDAQKRLVAFVEAHDGVTTGDIAAHLNMTLASERAGSLVKRGVIRRVATRVSPKGVPCGYVYYGLKKLANAVAPHPPSANSDLLTPDGAAVSGLGIRG